jgi:hypothetical protein
MEYNQSSRNDYINHIPTTVNGYKNKLQNEYHKNMANKQDDYGFHNKQQYVSDNLIDRMNMFSRFDENIDRNENTKKIGKKVKYRIKTNDDDYEYNPEKRKFNFYQICRFEIDDKHLIRKLVYDQNLNLLRNKKAKIKKEKLKTFIKNTNDNKYILYPTYNFDGIDLPSDTDVLLASSQILNNHISCM